MSRRGELAVARERKIMAALHASTSATVNQLSELTGASPATIRRDLVELEKQGLLQRIHGGASLPERTSSEVVFELRESHELEAKVAIAKAALAELEPNETVLLDSGTTILQLARQLRMSPMPLTVVTNSLAIARELLDIESVDVILCGGQLHRRNLSFVGPLAESAIGRFWVDRTFIGATGVDVKAGITTPGLLEAEVNRLMLSRSKRNYLLVDATKFDKQYPFFVTSVTEIDTIITDVRLEGTRWEATLKELGVRTIYAQPATPATES